MTARLGKLGEKSHKKYNTFLTRTVIEWGFILVIFVMIVICDFYTIIYKLFRILKFDLLRLRISVNYLT